MDLITLGHVIEVKCVKIDKYFSDIIFFTCQCIQSVHVTVRHTHIPNMSSLAHLLLSQFDLKSSVSNYSFNASYILNQTVQNPVGSILNGQNIWGGLSPPKPLIRAAYGAVGATLQSHLYYYGSGRCHFFTHVPTGVRQSSCSTRLPVACQIFA